MEMVNKGFDSDGFTRNVTAAIEMDGSLDFENNKVFKSRRVDDLKEKFKNRMPSRRTDLASAKSQLNLPNLDSVRKSLSILSKEDRSKVREDVIKTVVTINELEAIENMIQESKSSAKSEFGHIHNPSVAENSFEAILSFNDDMKVLAMNAY